MESTHLNKECMVFDESGQAHQLENQPKDLLSRWIETGFSSETISMYGCSTEELMEFLRQGFVTPHFTSKDNTSKYYMIACNQHLGDSDPSRVSINTGLHDRYDTDESRDYGLYDNEERQLKTVRSYALMHAVSTYVDKELQAFGITEKLDITDVMQLASEILPDFPAVLAQIDEAGYVWSGEFSSPNYELVNLIRSKCDTQTLDRIVRNAIQRRGVLLFFDSSILSKATPLLEDFEDEGELNFVSQSPLRLSVISGIEVLSDSEKNELLK